MPDEEEEEEEVEDGWSKAPGKKGKTKKSSQPAAEACAPQPAAPVFAGLPAESASDGGRRLECAGCHKSLPHANFSGTQLKKGTLRQCQACVEGKTSAVAVPPPCVKCKRQLGWDAFNKKIAWDNPKCKSCLEEEQIELSKAACVECKQKLDRRSFRNRVDWNSPTCRECLEKREQREYDERLAQYEQEALLRQRQREEMSEAERKAYIEEKILNPAQGFFGELLSDRGEATFYGDEENPDLLQWAGHRRFDWAATLADRISEAMSSGLLSSQWRHETPSRDHASDRGAAEAFKELEDLGDRLVQDEAAELFERFVLGQEIVTCTREELLGSVETLEGERSWRWSDPDMVVAAVRPVDGWDEISCAAEDLRAEPRSGALHAGGDLFAQFDQDAPAKMGRILPPGARVEVKLYREACWSDLEQILYEGRAEVGSHNQTFHRAYGLAGGTGAGANRTEIMNLVADMLGFHDADKHSPDQSWSSVYNDVLPPRLRVHYGFGKEFRADKAWATKMEANVLEALIGALSRAGLEDLASAVVGLCFLTYISVPRGVLPSNWAMAEKFVMLAKNLELCDAFVVRNFDAEGFCRRMQNTLA